MPIFGLLMPKNNIKDVPKEILRPADAWAKAGTNPEEFTKTVTNLAGLFQKNFKDFANKCSPAVRAAGPK